MKKASILLLALILCLGLCGCSAGEIEPLKDGILTYEELTMELPEGYVRLNTREYEGLFTFTYGAGDNLVIGYREPTATILGQYPDMNKVSYAEKVIQSSGVEAQVQEIDGITCFTFQSADLEEGKQYTYLAAVYQCEESFWLMQTCCQSKNFEEEEEGFWTILKSVKLELPENTN